MHTLSQKESDVDTESGHTISSVEEEISKYDQEIVAAKAVAAAAITAAIAGSLLMIFYAVSLFG
ncbi:MAG: hypothetical protein HRU20_00885 [Pseudomonadales bacterium]|nr:hypothetical protein [Pseudomonadales bacterium]